MPDTSPSPSISTSISTRSKARPSSLACVECRKHHIKCDARRPTCSRCAAARVNCVFLPSRRGGRRKIAKSPPRVPFATPPVVAQREAQPETSGTTQQQATRLRGVIRYSEPNADNPLQRLDLPESTPEFIVPEARLVRLYYENFHAAHPILVPAALFNKWQYPPYLQQVVKFIGTHYSLVLDNDILSEPTWMMLNATAERTPHMVQALLLYSIMMRARNEPSQAELSLTRAIDMALELGMNREEFVITAAAGAERGHEMESLRRTWWTLFTWEIYMTSLSQVIQLRCSDVHSDVQLPCEESTYSSLETIPPPQSLAAFRSRIFSENEDGSQFSSFAYYIESARILSRVVILNAVPETHHDHLQAVANTLVSWIHHLPPRKNEIVDMYGTLDEMMFQAHCTIQYAAMLLHLPRSNIRPRFPDSMFSICPITPFRLSPSLTRQVHDVKTLEASKSLSNLLSVRSDVRGYSPSVVFVAILCGLVQLAATETHGPECADHHHNRIVLILGCLKQLRGKWSLAQVGHAHLRGVAAQVMTLVPEYSPFERKPLQPQPPDGSGPRENQDSAAISSMLMDDELMTDPFSSRLFSEFIDPTCGASFL
ncbi:Fungal Zn(2)-Cys(6) binuclear cluster domain-containing protein [Penicillium ucsense]|uniref:Fungal Zn(2)-Cys(6) binuclear cluster domain-containing protein n=1 Tax=Penicillium ucsense TaxID=2839758 RepID=A0A8J8W8Y2_9EURO|nr:Fungal Zn(2)-Cys(6) binuclear cluster domain-containing protein [Penicillium ucsense]KAF7733776.1 Fungal Zn(2)-Cys(6) binuclear cluster domain-containing protein [Penicillium ucsense]